MHCFFKDNFKKAIEFYEIINFFNVKRRLKCPYKHTKKPKMDFYIT